MDNVYVRQYIPTDIQQINAGNEDQIERIKRNNPNYFTYLLELTSGNCYTVLKDEKIVSIVGWVTTARGVGDMFLIPSKDLKDEFCKGVLKAYKEILAKASSNHVRLQADCEDNDVFKRFLEHFGFQKEGVMKSAGDNWEDLTLYSYVNDALKMKLKHRDRINKRINDANIFSMFTPNRTN